MSATYVVCGCKSWNKRVFEQQISNLPGTWHYIEQVNELTVEILHTISPKYVFFLHWSWIVTAEITSQFECINFHMTDLPYGRGGSPLQNLILRGHTKTKLTAHRMSKQLDEGPIYLQKDLSLEGTAQHILERACELSAQMIAEIISTEPEPTAQTGEITVFQRRTPEMSEMPKNLTNKQKYDFIRMLDGEGYPPAFQIIDGIRYEYRNANLHNDTLSFDRTPCPL